MSQADRLPYILPEIVFTSVSVIIPVMNEISSLIQTVETIINNDVENIREIILVVCKKTSEQSLSTCHLLASRYEGRVIIYWQYLPRLGGALREGLDIAQSSHAIVMYSDAESDPYSAKDLIIEAKKHPDAIISASRWLKDSTFINYPKTKQWLNFAFQKFFSFFYNSKITDFTFGYRIYPIEIMRRIKWEEVGHSFVFESILKPVRMSINVIEISTQWRARSEGESQANLTAYLRYIWIGFKIRFLSVRAFWNPGKYTPDELSFIKQKNLP